jgi:predicted homoserine dehydrogenase-like protein
MEKVCCTIVLFDRKLTYLGPTIRSETCMPDLLSRLRALPKKIRVGVIGVGSIGKGLVYQAGATPGMECVAIADIRLEHACAWAKRLGRDYLVVENLADMQAAIRAGRLAVCSDGNLVAQCEQVNVLVDSSNSIRGGLQFAQTAIANHKHVVMMNSEADLIFGPHLLVRANREGVVYTSADGDQHTVLKRLINDTELWGFQTVMAGNMKGYLDRYSNPTAIIPEADKRFMDYKMCASYTDGTKLCIEMALTANSIGGRVAVPGMLGPSVGDIYEVFQHFDFPSLWDGKTPLVDYVLGARPPGGVFVVGFNDHPHQMETLGWYPCRLGAGPFYVFHRPYHLGHMEGMACIAEACLDGWAVLQPTHGLVTNVYAYAKKDLYKGETLDGIGGYAAYGLIENCADNLKDAGLPICLAEDVTLRRDVRKDEKILLEDIMHAEADPRFEIFMAEME